ncbi:hypothetical protein E2C01_066365 [Portunus trituberculatus]|uniref:Uncharacterized protein n=1 Tax=Portunus trituberculatus TaxID=210409 RepID=A0A5B7HLB0_PORTR|nr:hypothetical protein [Portunus trituberculatus]
MNPPPRRRRRVVMSSSTRLVSSRQRQFLEAKFRCHVGRANTRLVQLCTRAQEDVKPGRPSGPNSPSEAPQVTAQGVVRVSALLLKRTFFKKWRWLEEERRTEDGKREKEGY